MGNNNVIKPDIPVIKIRVPKGKIAIPDNIGSCGCGDSSATVSQPNSCCSPAGIREIEKHAWITGAVETAAGKVPIVSTRLDYSDRWGTVKARCDINRMNYKITPGLYAVGEPGDASPVLVTANYKLTFDSLRKELVGLNAWILVLDTKGINVWCAAGKGTFGTDEIIKRVSLSGLSKVVFHRTLILPQLGAPGTSAHKITAATGFKVIYGPVRASDVKSFIDSGMKATPEMRIVKFDFIDRLVLTPVEIAVILRKTLLVLGVLFLLNIIGLGPFGVVDFYAFAGALAVGCILTPLLLPYIPGRAFAWKGWLLGIIWVVVLNVLNGWPDMPAYSLLKALGYILILPPVSAYLAMNFTGASTYTSPSGVNKEMRIAIPAMILSLLAGCVLILVNNLVY